MAELVVGGGSLDSGEQGSGKNFSDTASCQHEKDVGSACLHENDDYAVGRRESARAIRKKLAKRVFVAEDASSQVVAPLVDECRYRGVEVVFVPSKAELGKMAGIEREASIVCVLKQDE